jgi:hypothetical protein
MALHHIFCSLSHSRLQLKLDGTRWHTGGEVKGKLVNAVGSQYPSHYLGTRCIQHYYRWCAHLGCAVVDWTDAPPTGRFKWTGPFRTKDEIWFLRMCHHISTGLYLLLVPTHHSYSLPFPCKITVPLCTWLCYSATLRMEAVGLTVTLVGTTKQTKPNLT